MRELNERGYIKYEPSYNPFKGSMVTLFNFSEDLKPVQKRANTSKKILPVTEQVVNKQRTGYETSIEQALVPSINYINNTNILNDLNVVNLEKQSTSFENENKNVIAKNEAILENEKLEKEKSSTKKEMFSTFADTDKNKIEESRQKDFIVTSSGVEKPTIEIVKSYFQSQNFPEIEAQKFYNYFSSVGWLVGGKTPMVDWQASAQNWMLNTPKFTTNESQSNRAKQLNTTTYKDYSEPL